MKLARYGNVGEERPGVLDAAGELRSLYPLIEDFTCSMLTPEWRSMLAAIDVEKLPRVVGRQRLGVPVGDIRQIVAIGLNYRGHAAEFDVPAPEYPMVFLKSASSLSGCTDPIWAPRSAAKLDWEIELGFLIGSTARDVPVERALEHVAGYCTVIDVSERAWQNERGGQIGKGKSHDSFTPVGPWFVTADEIADPQTLELWLKVNGQSRQRDTTAGMIFGVAEIVAQLSQYMTLQPGDLVVTGTPGGVGMAMKPEQYLADGDEVTCGIQGLGDQRHAIELRP